MKDRMDHAVRQGVESRKMTPELLMRSVIQGLERGDTRPLLDALDDEVVWTTGAKQKGFFPFGGMYKGRLGVEEMLSDFSKRFRYRRITPCEVTSNGDTLWAIFDIELESTETSSILRSPRVISTEIAIHWRLRNNKILEHRGFFDTATLLFAPIAAASDSQTSDAS